ncbi:MAG: ATP-dependent helicase, partial [Deltaproteobacteria bacterium]|nr:ATP-dependent helicase [Deltaproteobacteria bacterium]
TFTRKAAQEMKDRIASLLNGNGKSGANLNIGTFHSICYRILRAEYAQMYPDEKEFFVLDEFRQRYLLKKVLVTAKSTSSLGINEIISVISKAKNELVSPKGLSQRLKDLFIDSTRIFLQRIYRAYEQHKEKMGSLDFDDLLLKTWQLFSKHPHIRQKYQQQFIHILLDEGQDTNHAQFEIIKQLLPPHYNLMIVGDDAQSIYSFRGARPEYLIDFDQTFQQTQTIKLEQNYRSTERIVNISNRLIQCNRVRTDKRLWTQNEEGAEIDIIPCDDQDDEADKITLQMQLLAKKGIKFSDMAVLYRTNGQSRALEDGCIAHRVPYVVIGTLGFYHRREIKGILAYLQLIQDQNNDMALSQIYNVPNRFLGKVFFRQLETLSRQRGTSLYDQLEASFSKTYIADGAKRLKYCIKRFQNYYAKNTNLPDLISFIRKSLDYDAYILQDEEITPDNSRIQNMNEFQIASSRFRDLPSFLFYVDQVQRRSQQNQEGQNKVHLMTIHKAKGLEYGAVFVAGCSEGLLPHFRDADNLEEARRLMYVAVTRAKDKLYLSWLRTYQDKGLTPSPFLAEMGFEIETEKKALEVAQ